MFQCDDYHNSIKESTDLVTTQVMAKRTKTASHVFWYRVYRNILASSSRWSAQSWTIKTRVPIRWEWVVQLNIIRAIVVLWWMNISQKVLSPHVKKLAETIGDQRRRHEPLFIDRIFNEANIHSLRQELDTLLKLL